jgi:hypothetical protein
VPFQIFQCDISTEDSSGKKETKRVYFVSSVLMGASIESAHAKQESKKDKRLVYVDGLDYYLDKVKKVNNAMVDINVKYKEPGTDLLVTKQEKNMTIEDMQICNTPRSYFFGYRPNPMSEFIDVSIMTLNCSRIFRSELETRENYKRHADREIAEAFRDLFICMTVETIMVERSEGAKEMMKLLIDGVEYGNIDKFKISIAYTSKDLPMTLPVRCFLPFEP